MHLSGPIIRYNGQNDSLTVTKTRIPIIIRHEKRIDMPKILYPLSYDMRSKQKCKTVNICRRVVSLRVIGDLNFEFEL